MDFEMQARHRIKSLMEEKKVSQYDVAKALGKSQSTVFHMLQGDGKSPLRSSYLPKLAALFQVPVDYFVMDERNTDSVRFGPEPDKEPEVIYDMGTYELKERIHNLENQVAQLTESREYYFNLANELAAEKQVLQGGEDLNVSTIKETCRKQLDLSITLMKTAMEMLEYDRER